MTIEQYTNNPNHYEVYDSITDAEAIAEFEIVENRLNGWQQIHWLYGEDTVDIDTLSEINNILYVG